MFQAIFVLTKNKSSLKANDEAHYLLRCSFCHPLQWLLQTHTQTLDGFLGGPMHASLFLLINSKLVIIFTVHIIPGLHKPTPYYPETLLHTVSKDTLQQSYMVDRAIADLHSHSLSTRGRDSSSKSLSILLLRITTVFIVSLLAVQWIGQQMPSKTPIPMSIREQVSQRNTARSIHRCKYP